MQRITLDLLISHVWYSIIDAANSFIQMQKQEKEYI